MEKQQLKFLHIWKTRVFSRMMMIGKIMDREKSGEKGKRSKKRQGRWNLKGMSKSSRNFIPSKLHTYYSPYVNPEKVFPDCTCCDKYPFQSNWGRILLRCNAKAGECSTLSGTNHIHWARKRAETQAAAVAFIALWPTQTNKPSCVDTHSRVLEAQGGGLCDEFNISGTEFYWWSWIDI